MRRGRQASTKFREGQFIVLTSSATKYSFFEGYIFKQREMNESLAPYDDGTGDDHVINHSFKRTDKTNWRFASTEEVALYKKYKHPVFVGKVVIDNFSII